MKREIKRQGINEGRHTDITHLGKVRKGFSEDVKFDTRMMTGNSSGREKGKGNLG